MALTETDKMINTGARWLLGIIVGGVVLYMIFGGGGGAVATPKYCSETDARVSARIAVENSLKNPDDADFSNSAAWDVQQDGDVYTVTGQVTATNSFNAKIKSTFTARVQCKAGNWTYGRVTMQ